MTTRFLQISDLHFSLDYQKHHNQYTKILSNMDLPFIQLEELLTGVDKDFAFVVVSGDICEYGSEDEYQICKDKLHEIFNCPIYTVCGNHDKRDNYFKVFEEKEFHDVIEGSYRIICLDSSSEEYNDGYISKDSCEKLEEALKIKTGLPTILVTHHHLIEDQFAMPMAKYPDKLKDIIKDSEINLIITGHTHHPYHGQFCGKEYYTTGSLSFVAENEERKLNFYQQPSISIYEIGDDIKCSIISSPKERRYLGSL